MTSVTTPELVRLIKRENETAQQAADRIHFWVRIGAIRSVGKKNPGRGIKRRYPANTPIRVALLTAAQEAGLTPKEATDMLQMPGLYLEPFLHPTAEPPSKPLFIVSARSDGRAPSTVRMDNWDGFAKYRAGVGEVFDTFKVVDVGKIRTRLNAALEAGDEIEPAEA